MESDELDQVWASVKADPKNTLPLLRKEPRDAGALVATVRPFGVGPPVR